MQSMGGGGGLLLPSQGGAADCSDLEARPGTSRVTLLGVVRDCLPGTDLEGGRSVRLVTDTPQPGLLIYKK
jgi:hypothetical protein